MSTTDTPPEATSHTTEMSGARALWILMRRFIIGSFALVGAFAIGMVVILAAAAFFSTNDDYDDDHWEELVIEDLEDDGFFGNTVRPAPAGGGLFPDEPPVLVEPRPTFINTFPVSLEYRVESSNNSIDLRSDGVCADDVRYSIVETDQEIRVSAELHSRGSTCSSSDWVTFRLNDRVGDRIVVNAEAGYTARPVIR